MTRAQIQLPDDVYARARKVCAAREISFAELSRRGLEYMLSVYAQEPAPAKEWAPPKPRRLGWKGLTDEQIKEEAQLTTTEAAYLRRRK
ncbi:MAG: antitoxin [Proteobacteria bacterium]|nr:antitoxin [Pseudomonadota bacterium]